MKKLIVVCCLIVSGLILSACQPTGNSVNKDDAKLRLTYGQYRKLVTDASKNLEFSTIPVVFSRTTLDNPLYVIVNEEMSFGKRKKFMTLNDEPKDSTQEQIIYVNLDDGYTLVTSWIYTDAFLGNDLLLSKQPESANEVFDHILSYKNILIHVQGLPSAKSKAQPESFGMQTSKAIIELNDFLKTYKPARPQ